MRARWVTHQPVSWSLASSSAIQGLGLLTGVLLARQLGPHDRGNLAAAMLWPALLAAIGNLGVQDAMTYYAARRQFPPGSMLGTALALAAAQSMCLVIAGAVLIPVVLATHDPITRQMATIYLAFVPLNVLGLFAMGMINGSQQFGTFHFFRFLVALIPATVLVAAALVGILSIPVAIFAYLASNTIVVGRAVVLLFRSNRAGDRTPLRVEAPLASTLLRFGVRGHMGDVASWLNERLDQLVVSVSLPPALLGLYVASVALASITTMIGSSIGMVMLPKLAGVSPDQARPLLLRAAPGAFWLSIVVAVPLLILAPLLVSFLFGHAFEAMANTTRILLVAAVPLSLSRSLGAALRGLGRPLEAGVGDVLAIAVTIAGLAVLLPALGLIGAALTSLTSYMTSATWMLWRLSRIIGISPLRMILPSRELFRMPQPTTAHVLSSSSEGDSQ